MSISRAGKRQGLGNQGESVTVGSTGFGKGFSVSSTSSCRMQLEQHTKGRSVMWLLWQNRNLKVLSSPVGLQAEGNGTQKRQSLSLRAKAASMPREKEQREKEHRHSAETGLRKCVREVTQNYRMDQSLCSLWTGILQGGVKQRGPAPRDLGSWSTVQAQRQQWWSVKGGPA